MSESESLREQAQAKRHEITNGEGPCTREWFRKLLEELDDLNRRADALDLVVNSPTSEY